MGNKRLGIIWLFVAALMLHSCVSKLIGTQDDLPKLQEDRILTALDSIHKSYPEFLSTKIDAKYSDKKQNVGFKASLKVNADTAVHALISYAGIPLVTALVTTDSVKISNKKEKCYILQELDFFKYQFGIDFSYYNLQELLLGRPINYDRNRTYYIQEDPYNYTVSTQKDRIDEGRLLFTYQLSHDLKQLKRVEITSFKDEVTIVITYSEYWQDPVFSTPKLVNVEIKSPKNEIAVSMAYDKIELNVPKEMIIVIPESYEKCK